MTKNDDGVAAGNPDAVVNEEIANKNSGSTPVEPAKEPLAPSSQDEALARPLISTPRADRQEEPLTLSTAAVAAIRGIQEGLEEIGRTWDHWMDKVGENYLVLREEALRISGANSINSAVYARTMSRLLDENGLSKVLSKDMRAALLFCMENREDIEKWRSTLTGHERMQYNSPITVQRKFKAATKVPEAERDAAEQNAAEDDAEQDDEAADTDDEADAADSDDEAENEQLAATDAADDKAALKRKVAQLEAEKLHLAETLQAVAKRHDDLVQEMNIRRARARLWDAKMSPGEIADAFCKELAEEAPDKGEAVIIEFTKRREAFTKRVAEVRAAAEQQTAEPSAEVSAEPPPASDAPVVPSSQDEAAQQPPAAPDATTPASPQEPSWKPKPGRPKIGARRLVGAYRHLKKGPIYCAPDDARAEGWAILEYCRREDGVKPEWLVVTECVSREQAQEALAASAAKAAEGGFVAGAGP
jgi:hypothetical protein